MWAYIDKADQILRCIIVIHFFVLLTDNKQSKLFRNKAKGRRAQGGAERNFPL